MARSRPLLARRKEGPLPFGARRETDPPLRVRDLGLHPGVPLLPVEGIEVDGGARDGLARPAGKDDRLRVPVSGGAPQHDQVPDDDVERPDAVRVPGEIVAGRGDREIEPRGEAGRQFNVGPVVAEIGRGRQVELPGRGRAALFEDAPSFVPLREEVVVLRGPDELREVDGIGPEVYGRRGSGA